MPGRVYPKKWIKELRYGVDWSVDPLDVFFSEEDFEASGFLAGSALFEVVLLGRDPLA